MCQASQLPPLLINNSPWSCIYRDEEEKGRKHSTSRQLLCLFGAWFPEHACLRKHLHVLNLAKVQIADLRPAELQAVPKDEVVSPKSPYAQSICKKERAGKRDCYSQPVQLLPDKSDAAAGMGCSGTLGLVVPSAN